MQSFYIDEPAGFRSNRAFGSTSNRKCQAILDVDPNNKLILLSVYSQKQVGFIIKWWIRYATTYAGRLRTDRVSHPLYFLEETDYRYRRILNKGGGSSTDVNLKTLEADDLEGRILEFDIQRETGHYTLVFAQFKPENSADEENYGAPCSLTGHLDFWSRGVPYESRGTGDINLSFPL